jgi:hypothetical protein
MVLVWSFFHFFMPVSLTYTGRHVILLCVKKERGQVDYCLERCCHTKLRQVAAGSCHFTLNLRIKPAVFLWQERSKYHYAYYEKILCSKTGDIKKNILGFEINSFVKSRAQT